MLIKIFFNTQSIALLFAAIISPLNALAGTDSKSTTIKFVLGTSEVLNYQKLSCPPSYLGGTITGVGTGKIIVNEKSTPLGIVSLAADDCITPLDFTHFSAEGNATFSTNSGGSITAHYSVSFVPTDVPLIYKYENFILQVTGGTGTFSGITGYGTVEGASNIQTGQGVIEGTVFISK